MEIIEPTPLVRVGVLGLSIRLASVESAYEGPKDSSEPFVRDFFDGSYSDGLKTLFAVNLAASRQPSGWVRSDEMSAGALIPASNDAALGGMTRSSQNGPTFPAASNGAGIALADATINIMERSNNGASPHKVLVADDKATGRELVLTVLANEGYLVFEASDGIEALVVAQRVQPDLIILDLHMPGLDGFGVIQELRLNPAFEKTPVVALTASAMESDRRRALDAGFTGFITKPVSLKILRAEVERLLL